MSDDPFASDSDPLLRAILRAARLRRGARELADEEFEQGAWVEDEDPEEAPVRLAAADDRERTYAAGAWAVRLARVGDRVSARQTGGAAGLTLVVGESMLPLEPGEDQPFPSGAFPAALDAFDARGRPVRLEPEG